MSGWPTVSESSSPPAHGTSSSSTGPAPGAIQAPVVVLCGSDTKPVFTASARYVAERVANARVREIPGAGHAAPLTHPEPLAEALTALFSQAQPQA